MNPSSRDASTTTRVEPGSAPSASSARRRPRVAPAVVGAKVGRYIIVEEIGQGGMGRVLRAYDPKLQREVALKEVRRDRLGKDGADRLVAEARAMAKLSHPNVVSVFDVEEAAGEVVLVMEFVPGTTMRGWLQAEPRPWDEVVRWFALAGRGLAAAHAAGLLHRDFKPSNVLVSQTGRGPVVKVTDFGLAKGVDAPVSSAGITMSSSMDELLTESGTVLGTPRYMAPEQHAGRSLTPAADLYGLCIALWEALCGEPPFAGKDMVQRKHGPPPAWSNPDVPRRIVAAIERGLAVEPQDRWPSVDDFLAVLTHDPSWRRARWAWGGGVAATLAVAGVGWSSMGVSAETPCSGASRQLQGVWDDERRGEVEASMLAVEGSYAEDAWDRTGTALDDYTAQWTQMYTEACEATVIRKERSEAMMDLQMACLQRARDEVGAATQILASADAKVVQKSHKLVGGLSDLSRCADLDALSRDVAPPEPDDAAAVAVARRAVADSAASRRVARFEQARDHLREADGALEGIEYGPVRTEVLHEWAQVLRDLGEYTESSEALDAAIESATQWQQWPLAGNSAALAMDVVGVRLGKPAEGLRYRGLAAGVTAGDPVRHAHTLNNLGLVLDKLARYEEAEATLREALQLRLDAGTDPLGVAQSRNNLGTVLYSQGRIEEAAQEFRAVVHVRQDRLGPAHPLVAMAINNVGAMLEVGGHYAEAEAEHRRALAVFEAAFGPEHPRTAGSRNNLANVLDRQGKSDEAEAEYRRALDAYREALGPEHPRVAMALNNIGTVLQARGEYPEAEAEFRSALAIWKAAVGEDHPDVLEARHNIASALKRQGKLAEAEAEYRQILAGSEASLPKDHPDLASVRHRLAKLLYERGERVEALSLAAQAWARRQKGDLADEAKGATGFLFAQALWDSGDRARAREVAQQALEAFERSGTADGAAAVKTWLGGR